MDTNTNSDTDSALRDLYRRMDNKTLLEARQRTKLRYQRLYAQAAIIRTQEANIRFEIRRRVREALS